MKTLTLIKYIFLSVGLCLLLVASLLYQNTHAFLTSARLTEGTVIDLVESSTKDSTVYQPIISFQDQNGDAFEFKSTSGSNPPGYLPGDKVEVLYEADNPEGASINSFFSLWGGTVIVASLGGVFFLIGGGILLFTFLKARSDNYLRLHGTRIETQFQSIELNESVSANGQHPYCVISHWFDPETSEIQIFKSDNLWIDPSDHIKSRFITVFIDKKKPHKYYMDTSFLPKSAESAITTQQV